jgi:hypothetical protein
MILTLGMLWTWHRHATFDPDNHRIPTRVELLTLHWVMVLSDVKSAVILLLLLDSDIETDIVLRYNFIAFLCIGVFQALLRVGLWTAKFNYDMFAQYLSSKTQGLILSGVIFVLGAPDTWNDKTSSYEDITGWEQ